MKVIPDNCIKLTFRGISVLFLRKKVNNITHIIQKNKCTLLVKRIRIQTDWGKNKNKTHLRVHFFHDHGIRPTKR